MHRIAAILLPLLIFTASRSPADELPAPPTNTEIPFALSESGPEGGFGTQTRGGLDGRIIRVTHLEDEGKGSLRMALEALQGPRTVVFEVSGQINLKRDIVIRHPHITIAGQTAPSPGITVANATLRIQTHDVVVQHLRCRVGNLPGKESLEDRDGIQLVGVKLEPDAKDVPEPHIYNVVIDHCSVSWTCDEGISTYFHGIRDVTVSNTIIAEPLDKAGHPKGGHSMALLVGAHSKNVTILGNLFAHSRYRNPVVKGNTTTIIANNVMYDIGSNAFHTYGGDGGPSLSTAVANVLLAGPTRRRESKDKTKPAAPTSTSTAPRAITGRTRGAKFTWAAIWFRKEVLKPSVRSITTSSPRSRRCCSTDCAFCRRKKCKTTCSATRAHAPVIATPWTYASSTKSATAAAGSSTPKTTSAAGPP
ncbi:MAG: hypothetical protein QM775_21440 [Pirellulales bacterium]